MRASEGVLERVPDLAAGAAETGGLSVPAKETPVDDGTLSGNDGHESADEGGARSCVRESFKGQCFSALAFDVRRFTGQCFPGSRPQDTL